ncbi:MAG: chemotaxis protein CheW [Bacillota bacterium]
MAIRSNQFIAFKLEDQVCGLPITEVDEIIPPREITNLPGTAEFIEGIINLRGEIVVIVDLRKRLEFEVAPKAEARIIVVDIAGIKVGFIVDEASEVIKIEAEQISNPTNAIAGIKNQYLKGIARLEDELVILLDLDRLLSTTEQAKISEVSEELA